ncbi:uncharacterized protein PG986_002892 [Apiospora aurea]|uniref:Uncharacterized protein n=1 Tax=Apiospora aurea TaxID=335848 RepID=A0ABR1QQZ2_9PEZI
MTTPSVTFDLTPEQEASKLQFIRRQFSGAPPAVARADVDLEGQTALVTGANGGIGLECCRQLLGLGVGNLVLAVRDEHKGEIARETLMADKCRASQNVEVWRLDYASYESVTEFARRAESVQPPLGIAVLNAAVNRASFALNPETGHEEDVQTNYLSTALLTLLLLRTFKTTSDASPSQGPGHIVLVSSDTAAWANFAEKTQDPLLPAFDEAPRFRTFDRYATTKLLGQLFVAELARRVPASASAAAVVSCANPGLCHGSGLNRELGLPAAVFMRLLGRSAAVGARSMAPFVYSEEAKVVSQRLWKETMAELSFAGVEKIVQDLS